MVNRSYHFTLQQKEVLTFCDWKLESGGFQSWCEHVKRISWPLERAGPIDFLRLFLYVRQLICVNGDVRRGTAYGKPEAALHLGASEVLF